MSGTVPDWARRFQEVLDGKSVGHKRLAAMIKALNGGVTPPGGSAENLRAYRKGLVRNPRPAVMHLVSQELGVRYEWLVDGEGPMTVAEERIPELARQYGEGLPGAEAQIRNLRYTGGQHENARVKLWDAEVVTPAYFLTWRRLVQFRSPALTDKEITEVGIKLTMHLMTFLATTSELNGGLGSPLGTGRARSFKWHTDVALAWLSAVAVTAVWDRTEED